MPAQTTVLPQTTTFISPSSTTEAQTRDLLHFVETHKECMFTTHDALGRLCARPMWVRRVDPVAREFLLVAAKESGKAADVKENSACNIAILSGTDWASISGSARVSSSPALVQELWGDDLRTWLPSSTTSTGTQKEKGPEDVVVIIVTPESAHYAFHKPLAGMVQRGLVYLKELVMSVAYTGTNVAASTIEMAKEKAGQTYEVAKEKVGQGYEVAKEKAGQGYEVAKEKAGQGYEVAKEKAGQGYEVAKEKAGQTYVAAKETAEAAKERASQGVEVAKEKTIHGAEMAKEKANQGYEAAKETAGQGVEAAKGTAEAAKNTAGHGIEVTKEKAGHGYESAKAGLVGSTMPTQSVHLEKEDMLPSAAERQTSSSSPSNIEELRGKMSSASLSSTPQHHQSSTMTSSGAPPVPLKSNFVLNGQEEITTTTTFIPASVLAGATSSRPIVLESTTTGYAYPAFTAEQEQKK